MQMEIEVKGQRIKRINSPGSVEDTLNYLTCHFIFSGEEWDNTVKTAYFENPASGKRHPKILADDGTCTVPWEALTDKGFVRFSVAGERDGYRITTGIESFYNSETIYGGEPSEPPTPDQYDQLIALAQETKEIAESVREDADAGEFDGPPGPQGPKGENGDTGPRGPAGKDGQNATDEQVRAAVEAYMEEHPIQGDTEDIIKLAIKNEASGAVPVVIADSAEMGVQDIKMQGWTEQASTTGAQLINLNEMQIGGLTGVTGVEFEAKNRIRIGYTPVTAGTVYTLSGYSPYVIANSHTYDSSKQRIGSFSSGYEISEGGAYIKVSFAKSDQSDFTENDLDELKYTIMLNAGSTALPYEPYTGGQPSPNPDYPQEIVSAGKYDDSTRKYEYEVKLTGANLFDLRSDNLSLLPLITIAGDKQDINSGVRLTYENVRDCVFVADFAFEAGKTYFVSFDINMVLDILDGSTVLGYKPIVVTSNDAPSWWDRDVFEISYKIGTTHYKGMFTPEKECTMYISGNNGIGAGTGYTEITNFILTEVENADYEPYRTPQTVTLTSDRHLTKWDKLEKRNGQWGWVHKSMEITLDGSENWGVYAAYEGFSVRPVFDTPRTRSEGFSERFICETGITNLGKYTLLWLGANNRNIYFVKVPQYNEELPDSGLQDWKDYLAENPLTILTYADEETFAPLSESEQSALNALTTYYPTTVLDNDQGCDMTLTYIADTKAYIDNKVSAIQTAIVNTI